MPSATPRPLPHDAAREFGPVLERVRKRLSRVVARIEALRAARAPAVVAAAVP